MPNLRNDCTTMPEDLESLLKKRDEIEKNYRKSTNLIDKIKYGTESVKINNKILAAKPCKW